MLKPFPLLLSFCLAASLIGLSQTSPLLNRWTTGANVLYLGIDNELRAAVGMNKILSARSSGAAIEVNDDSASLTVRPSAFGPVTLLIRTETDSLTVTYQSDFLPVPQIGLEAVGFNIGFLSCEQLAMARGLQLRGHRTEAGRIYENSRLSCYELQIGEQMYTGEGSVFPESIRQALQALKPGQKIIIRSLYLEPLDGGRPLRLEPGRVMVVTD
jgi:hypothetical protein